VFALFKEQDGIKWIIRISTIFLKYSHNIRVIKSSGKRWALHVIDRWKCIHFNPDLKGKKYVK
jgi:hypothetical protein